MKGWRRGAGPGGTACVAAARASTVPCGSTPSSTRPPQTATEARLACSRAGGRLPTPGFRSSSGTASCMPLAEHSRRTAAAVYPLLSRARAWFAVVPERGGGAGRGGRGDPRASSRLTDEVSHAGSAAGTEGGPGSKYGCSAKPAVAESGMPSPCMVAKHPCKPSTAARLSVANVRDRLNATRALRKVRSAAPALPDCACVAGHGCRDATQRGRRVKGGETHHVKRHVPLADASGVPCMAICCNGDNRGACAVRAVSQRNASRTWALPQRLPERHEGSLHVPRLGKLYSFGHMLPLDALHDGQAS